MSLDISIRPAGVATPAPVVPTTSEAVSNAVSTVLPASQSVTAADPAAAARNDVQTPSDVVSRQAFVDPAAASIVFQTVDDKTGTVIQQFPDEAVLRRRAYFHALDLSRENSPRPLVTDVKA
jgi:hypothetical protein